MLGKFEDKDLEDRSWKVIEVHAEEAVTSDEFVTLEKSLVESVVKRERLNLREVVLFKAAQRLGCSICVTDLQSCIHQIEVGLTVGQMVFV